LNRGAPSMLKPAKKLQKVLIANRGEIALRIHARL
jgi:pyruvate carboxylase